MCSIHAATAGLRTANPSKLQRATDNMHAANAAGATGLPGISCTNSLFRTTGSADVPATTATTAATTTATTSC